MNSNAMDVHKARKGASYAPRRWPPVPRATAPLVTCFERLGTFGERAFSGPDQIMTALELS